VRDFYKFSVNERRFLTGAALTFEGRLQNSGSPNRPYFAPFQPVIRRVLGYAPPCGKANFFFGLGRPFAQYATGLYSNLRDNQQYPYRERFGDISFPLAKETPELQAADLLAHMTYLHMLSCVKSKHWYVNPPEVVRILHRNLRNAGDLVCQDERCIRETLKLIPIERRGELLVDDLAV
jgi:hypothetical protein